MIDKETYIYCYSSNISNYPKRSFPEWSPCMCDREISDIEQIETSALHLFFMISNIFVIFVFGLRCMDLTSNVTRYSNNPIYRNKHKRVAYQQDSDDESNDSDRWNEGIDAKFINRLLARLLIHWNYSWTDPVPASNRIINTLPCIKYDENYNEERCPICLSEFSEKPRKSLTMLRCQHMFHRKCITEWLMSSSTCPNCRYDFPTDNQLYEEYKRLLDND